MDGGIIILMIVGLIVLLVLTFFLIYGLPPLIRWNIRKTGEPARAILLEKRFGRWVVYSDGEHSSNVSSQQVILKLEVHPANGAVFIAEDKFMAKAMDLFRLNEGCELQVFIARNNPQKVVCLPETAVAGRNAPVQARAGMAMADLFQQANQGITPNVDQVMNALKTQNVQVNYLNPDQMMQVLQQAKDGTPVIFPGMQQTDPQANLQKLKEMLDSGLITLQEYEAKKKEILARM